MPIGNTTMNTGKMSPYGAQAGGNMSPVVGGAQVGGNMAPTSTPYSQGVAGGNMYSPAGAFGGAQAGGNMAPPQSQLGMAGGNMAPLGGGAQVGGNMATPQSQVGIAGGNMAPRASMPVNPWSRFGQPVSPRAGMLASFLRNYRR